MRQKSHPIKSAWSTSKLACILITWVILCLLVRITIKDRFPLIAAIYYAGPLVTCGMWLILAAALFLHKRRYRFAAALAIAGILLAVAWCINSYQQNELPSQEAHLRIIFWNLGRGDASQSLQFLVEQYHPDTVAMVESGALEDKPSEFWETHFAGYRFHYAGGGVSVLTRISCALLDFEKIGPCSRLARFAMGDGDAQWRLAITDIASNPLCFRKPLLVKVLTKAAEETTVPVIIAGDFNTPLDSVWFEPYRQKFHHAFETAGRGHPATWPSFAPILTIDHVWASPDMQITQTTLVSIPSGDHRAVMVDMQPN